MPRTISELMTSPARTVGPDTSLRAVSRIMRDENVGDVIVTHEDGSLMGILTDRDIVVRCLAAGGDCDTQTAGATCSAHVATVPPQCRVSEAVDMMRSKAVRRLPVVDDEDVVGIISIGDLAQAVDEHSALADVSSAEPNR
ncbi:CBS domain-containing protein [Nocardiopsis sp. EMB25]|uniref:CBS domain-containing protein n=1 Tax=Nocardiopsis TaxID=2013 RepID=UPI00034C62D6|nr:MULTISPECIES: CBS domain-containing protein [Nocardiopsis]MCY9784973.1 CBS domain-containing protein [Nocardiopsis sp. EMB25]